MLPVMAGGRITSKSVAKIRLGEVPSQSCAFYLACVCVSNAGTLTLLI